MALVLIMVATLKVREDEAGTDTLAECVGIVVGTTLGASIGEAWQLAQRELIVRPSSFGIPQPQRQRLTAGGQSMESLPCGSLVNLANAAWSTISKGSGDTNDSNQSRQG